MRVWISNDIEIENPTLNLMDWCRNNLIVDNPTWLQLYKMGKEDTIKRKHISKELKLYTKSGDRIRIPMGCIYGIWNLIKNSEIYTKFNECNDLTIKYTPCPLDLYDYQESALSAALSAKGGVIVAPCGAGKTTIGIELIHRLGKKALWLTHTKALLTQAANDMKNLYPNLNIGYITDGKVDIGKDITISTVQTLEKVDPQYYANEFEVIIVDECHKVSGSPTFAKMFQRVLSNLRARYKYGLTATPFRADSLTRTIYTNLGMNQKGQFEPIYTITRDKTNTLTAEHVKIDLDTESSYDFLLPDGTIDYMLLIDYLCENEQRNEAIVDNVMKCHEEGRKQALLSLRVSQCKTLYDMLKEKGVNVVLLTGGSTKKQREEILGDTDSWDIIISTMSLFKEGINIKALDCVHLCAPDKNKSGIIQACGRCERVLPGKKDPKFFDYVDTQIKYCVNAYKKRVGYLKNRE